MALDTALSIALAPLLLAQTAWTVRRAERLPEPEGDRRGATGSGPRLRFLQIGDSSAVGVGVPRQSEALAPQLAARLGTQYRVHWTLCGANGATTADAPRLLEPLAGQRFDAAYVIFGVNDTKNLRPAHLWRRDYRALIERLKRSHGVRLIFVSGLPPVEEFPLIPHPLRYVLSLRARRFDRALCGLVQGMENCHHLPLPAGLDPAGMASDGFHPGAPIYADWAAGAAEAMRPWLLQMGLSDMPGPDHPNDEPGNADKQGEGRASGGSEPAPAA